MGSNELPDARTDKDTITVNTIIGNYVIVNDGEVATLNRAADTAFSSKYVARPPVFVSYASEDRPFVGQLVELLQDADYTVWFDRNDIAAGEDWQSEINVGIHRCVAMVAIISANTIAKVVDEERGRVLRHEHSEALRLFRPIIPLIIDDSELPDYFPDRTQYIRLTAEEVQTPKNCIAKIVAELQRHSHRTGRFLINQTPSESKRFIGREEELSSVYKQLRQDNAIILTSAQTVTVQGVGGIGKTMLAGELVRRLSPRYPGGVLHVQFRPPVADNKTQENVGVEIVPTVLNRWAELSLGDLYNGNKQYSVEEIRGTLANFGKLLVLIDDVWDYDTASLQLLLQSLPTDADRIITTRFSQVATAVGGNAYSLAHLNEVDSKVFLRNRLVDKGALPSEAELGRLWQVVEGHPLSLELFAGRLQDNSTFSEKVTQLSNLIETGDGLNEVALMLPDSQLNRNTALEANLKLTWDALEQRDEQLALRFMQLGVFAPVGDYSRDALMGVWEEEDIRSTQSSIDHLLAWDLLNFHPTDAGSVRFQQHGILRAYALSRLNQANLLDAVRDRHFHYYAECYGNSERNRNVEEVYPLIDIDWPNIVSAIFWGLEHLPEAACDFVVSLSDSYMLFRVPTSMHISLLADAAYAARTAEYYYGVAHCSQLLGQLSLKLGDVEKAEKTLRAALMMYEELGNQHGVANTLGLLADYYLMVRDLISAQESIEKASIIFEEVGDDLGWANALLRLGQMHEIGGHYDDAAMYLRQAKNIFNEETNIVGQGYSRLFLGMVLLEQGLNEEGVDSLQEAKIIFERLEDLMGLAQTLYILGTAKSDLGDEERAIAYFEQAMELAYSDDNDVLVAKIAGKRAGILAKLGLVIEALQDCLVAEQVLRERGLEADADAIWRIVGQVRSETGSEQFDEIWKLQTDDDIPLLVSEWTFFFDNTDYLLGLMTDPTRWEQAVENDRQKTLDLLRKFTALSTAEFEIVVNLRKLITEILMGDQALVLKQMNEFESDMIFIQLPTTDGAVGFSLPEKNEQGELDFNLLIDHLVMVVSETLDMEILPLINAIDELSRNGLANIAELTKTIPDRHIYAWARLLQHVAGV